MSSVLPRVRGLYARGMRHTDKYIEDFGGESEGMGSHRGPRCRWDNNIKNWHSETGRKAVDWIQVIKD